MIEGIGVDVVEIPDDLSDHIDQSFRLLFDGFHYSCQSRAPAPNRFTKIAGGLF